MFLSCSLTKFIFHNRKDRDGIEKILAVPELADVWRGQLEERLAKLK